MSRMTDVGRVYGGHEFRDAELAYEASWDRIADDERECSRRWEYEDEETIVLRQIDEEQRQIYQAKMKRRGL